MRLATKYGRAFDQDDARFNPLLRKRPCSCAINKWNRPRAHRRDADGDLGLGECRAPMRNQLSVNTANQKACRDPYVMAFLLFL